MQIGTAAKKKVIQPRFHNLVSELRRREEESGQGKEEETSQRTTFGGQSDKHLQRRTTIGRAKDAQAQNQFSRSVKKTKTKETRAAQ